MTRSSSRLFSIALVALGAVLGFLVAVKAPEFLQSDSPAPVISSRSPEPPAHPHPHDKKSFLKAVRLTGSVGSGGWKGDATWTGKHGSTLSLGSTISQNGVEEVGATAGYKSHDWHRVPDLEVGASMKPGKPGVAYSAKMSKVLDGSLEPTVSAQLTNSGWSLGTSFSKELKDGVDMEMDLKMPISVSGNSSEVDLVVDGKATYKVKGGKLVGTLGGKASSGLRGVSYGMSYDLGL